MLKNTLGWVPAAVVSSGCSQAGSVVGTAPAQLAMPKPIDVVFNHDTRSRYRSPLTEEWRNGDHMKASLIETIDGATEEVLVAVQELSLPRIAQALIAAQQRGIRVAVVMKNNYRQAWSEQRQAQTRRLFQDWPLQQTCQTESLCGTRADRKSEHSKHAGRHQKFSQASL